MHTIDYWRTYLTKAKNGNDRPINGSSSKRVITGPGTSIRLRLHDTDVVTLHDNGEATIATGGWETVTTKGFISEFSLARVYSVKGRWYVTVRDPEFTAPKVWKCRACKGVGTIPSRCQGPYRCHHWGNYTCHHGFTETHTPTECVHGRTGAHALTPVECYQCKGAGRYDYGSNPIHFEWNGDPLRVDADGYAVEYTHAVTGAEPLSKPKTHSGGWNSAPDYTYAAPPVPSSYSDSGQLLRSALPGLTTMVECPHCRSHMDQVSNLIIHLNDAAEWAREAIADWLDTLDVDLSFPVPEHIPAHVH